MADLRDVADPETIIDDTSLEALVLLAPSGTSHLPLPQPSSRLTTRPPRAHTYTDKEGFQAATEMDEATFKRTGQLFLKRLLEFTGPPGSRSGSAAPLTPPVTANRVAAAPKPAVRCVHASDFSTDIIQASWADRLDLCQSS